MRVSWTVHASTNECPRPLLGSEWEKPLQLRAARLPSSQCHRNRTRCAQECPCQPAQEGRARVKGFKTKLPGTHALPILCLRARAHRVTEEAYAQSSTSSYHESQGTKDDEDGDVGTDIRDGCANALSRTLLSRPRQHLCLHGAHCTCAALHHRPACSQCTKCGAVGTGVLHSTLMAATCAPALRHVCVF